MIAEKKRGATIYRFTVTKDGRELCMYAETKPEKDAWVKFLTDLSASSAVDKSGGTMQDSTLMEHSHFISSYYFELI
jgi:hypothetical protein